MASRMIASTPPAKQSRSIRCHGDHDSGHLLDHRCGKPDTQTPHPDSPPLRGKPFGSSLPRTTRLGAEFDRQCVPVADETARDLSVEMSGGKSCDPGRGFRGLIVW